jgi:hypothetical protein
VAVGVRGVADPTCTKLIADPLAAALEPSLAEPVPVVAADTFVENPQPEMERMRKRQQARSTAALPHQPLNPGRDA